MLEEYRRAHGGVVLYVDAGRADILKRGEGAWLALRYAFVTGSVIVTVVPVPF
jgi:hypothetical protein